MALDLQDQVRYNRKSLNEMIQWAQHKRFLTCYGLSAR